MRQKAQMDAGQDVHWYYKFTFEKIGDLDDALRRCLAGELVWVDTGHGPLYGATMLGPTLIQRLIDEQDLPLEILAYDTQFPPQDVLILRRT